jgi:hypothetical protein
MFLKIIGVILIVIGLYWAYNNVGIDLMDICIDDQEEMLPITCQIKSDCVNYLTSAYTIGYPKTELFTDILEETTSCKDGHCYLKSFDFKNNLINQRCGDNQSIISYKVTGKDIMAIKGGEK